jgi:hypothetical protein
VEHTVKTGAAEEKVRKRRAGRDSNRNKWRTYLNCRDAESRLRDGGSEIGEGDRAGATPIDENGGGAA